MSDKNSDVLRDGIFYVSVEGNIGSGKSTLIRYVQEHPEEFRCDNVRVEPVLEPLEAFLSPFLERFYSRPNEPSEVLALQLQVLRSYVEALSERMLKEAARDEKVVFIIERSAWSSRRIFMDHLENCGCVSAAYGDLYRFFYDQLERQFSYCMHPDAILHIDTDPAICLKRISERARPCEAHITPFYLKAICDHSRTILSESGSGIAMIHRVKSDDAYVMAEELKKLISALVEGHIKHSERTQSLPNR